MGTITSGIIEKFIGKPFKDGGRGPEYDCWGLVKAVFQEFGIKLPDYRISCFASEEINAKIAECRGQWRPLREPKVPCLVVLKADPDVPESCTHCGVYVAPGKFLHTLIKTGVIQTRTDHAYWKTRIEGYYEWKNNS